MGGYKLSWRERLGDWFEWFGNYKPTLKDWIIAFLVGALIYCRRHSL
jgi:hypothetical protein